MLSKRTEPPLIATVVTGTVRTAENQ